jgi:hypothetical protein
MFKRIKNFPDYYVNEQGVVLSFKRNKSLKLKPCISSNGYLKVNLYNDRGRKTISLHRLIAENFIDNEDNKECINHKDGNKLNNQIENLEWCTYTENNHHAIENNLSRFAKGENNGSAKLRKEDVLKIIDIKNQTKWSNEKISKIYNVNRKTIGNILRGVTWSHITGIEKESVK